MAVQVWAKSAQGILKDFCNPYGDGIFLLLITIIPQLQVRFWYSGCTSMISVTSNFNPDVICMLI